MVEPIKMPYGGDSQVGLYMGPVGITSSTQHCPQTLAIAVERDMKHCHLLAFSIR